MFGPEIEKAPPMDKGLKAALKVVRKVLAKDKHLAHSWFFNFTAIVMAEIGSSQKQGKAAQRVAAAILAKQFNVVVDAELVNDEPPKLPVWQHAVLAEIYRREREQTPHTQETLCFYFGEDAKNAAEALLNKGFIADRAGIYHVTEAGKSEEAREPDIFRGRLIPGKTEDKTEHPHD